MAKRSENTPEIPRQDLDSTNTSKTISHEEGSKKSSESKKKDLMDDCEFTVAADLTLYANPLRCLRKTAKPPKQHPETGPDMIAADLVKYGSPLDK
ncbi:hypothetical protein V1264_009306 [Littorina saxatilis]|uniref:Uncharacterized protein n=1 Tax=Littorina saxatilis TaxID=31220 RepID=A0AAN9ARF0_9CAEN